MAGPLIQDNLWYFYLDTTVNQGAYPLPNIPFYKLNVPILSLQILQDHQRLLLRYTMWINVI